jgi:hypothetical protein
LPESRLYLSFSKSNKMNARHLIYIIIISLFACNRGNKTETASDSLSNESAQSHAPQPVAVISDPVWSLEFDTVTQVSYLKPLRTIDEGTAKVQDMITILNKAWPEVQMKLVKVSGDTVYVRISESSMLTQQMGTTGAEAYMSTATYTLTEPRGIKYVNFDFREGDHAMPGTYERKSFKDIKPR